MITLSYGHTDAWVRSSNNNYSNAVTGSARVLNNSDVLAVVGQTYASSESTYYIRQYFVTFSYSRTSEHYPVSGYFRFYNNTTHGTNVSREVEIRAFNYGASVTTSSWRTPEQLRDLEISGILDRPHNFANGTQTYGGLMRVRGELTPTSSTLRYVLNSDRNRLRRTPSQVEYNSFASSRELGTDRDPMLVVGHTTLNRLTTTLAAQVQLTTGDWIFLERSDLTDLPTIHVKRRTSGGSETTLFSYPLPAESAGNDNFRSAQCYGLCRDDNDNFFMVRPHYSNTSQFSIRGFRKTGPSSWTEGTSLVFNSMWDDNLSNIMQSLCAWHSIGGGRLVVYLTRDWGRLGGAMESYYLFDASKILNNDSSNALLASGRGGEDRWSAKQPNAGPWNPMNATGTLCDIITDPNQNHTGYLLSGERHALLGENNTTSVGRYRIHSNGSQFTSSTLAFLDTNGGRSVYDPDAKLRAFCVGPDDLVKISADDRSDWGITMDRFKFTGSAYSHVGRVRLGSENIPTMPAAAALSSSSLWDAVYFPADNKIWVYYFDVGNARRLLRTSINLNDNLATTDVVQVVAAIGSSGDVPQAIRVQRNNMTSDNVMITVARRNSGSTTYSLSYHVDRINIPPTQPILTPKSNFNATSAQTFSWTFSDPNLVDNQTAYQIHFIRNSDNNVTDTGKVSSTTSSRNVAGGTLVNGNTYRWQVRTYDTADAVSPWSSQGTFITSNAGAVSITSPASDNMDLFTKDVTVNWTITPNNQTRYRVVVIRTVDGATFLDTDWISNSGTRSYTVMNLEANVEYAITVRTELSSVESVPATRLVTVTYNTPETPIVDVQVSPELEYATLSVTNPSPRGDRPNPTVNEVYRRVAGTSTAFRKVGECPPNGVFRDYSVGSGYNYEYKVRAGVEE